MNDKDDMQESEEVDDKDIIKRFRIEWYKDNIKFVDIVQVSEYEVIEHCKYLQRQGYIFIQCEYLSI